MKFLLNFFLSGIALGWSWCILSCGILIFPVIGDISSDWKQGLKNGIFFGIGKTISFSILGAIVSYSHFLFERFFTNKISLIIMGFLFILYSFWFYFFSPKKRFLKKFNLSPFFLGLLYGFIPCGPNIGFFIYLSYITKGIFFGILGSLFFSIGSLIGPVLILSCFSPYFYNKIFFFTKNKKYGKIFGLVIFLSWGINLILKGMK
ncbi:MAG: sulfite exporter TauE/SafE family protein [Candidatus Omnitrophica bacterium]|nr:sulfite exporter TauE/SafE family protein [Candidatus Omnitrophota bacterium]